MGLRCENKAAMPHIRVQRWLDRKQLDLFELEQGVTRASFNAFSALSNGFGKRGFANSGFKPPATRLSMGLRDGRGWPVRRPRQYRNGLPC